MLHNTFQTVVDTAVLAIEFDINPEVPPGAKGLMKMLNWLMWGVTLACMAALVFAGGKFAWEKWQHGQSPDAVKMVVASLVGVVVSVSANGLLNAVTSAAS